MWRYLQRRIVLMVPTFFGITLMTLALAQLAPGDPFSVELQGNASQQAIAHQRAAHGLDVALPVQFGRWLSRVARFDFGRSLIDQRLVTEKLSEAAPRTALVVGLALLFGFGLSVPLGVLLAMHAQRWWARLLTTFLLVGWSIPSFWIAMLLLTVFANPRVLNWFPLQGGVVLPVVCLAWAPLILATRQIRGSMLEALTQNYVKAARARGIPEERVIWRHALPNSLLPWVTMLGLYLPQVVGGSVLIERIFGIPGMGLLAFEAIGTRDYPTVMGVTTVMALATMVSMLLVDLAYGFIDPRIRLESAS